MAAAQHSRPSSRQNCLPITPARLASAQQSRPPATPARLTAAQESRASAWQSCPARHPSTTPSRTRQLPNDWPRTRWRPLPTYCNAAHGSALAGCPCNGVYGSGPRQRPLALSISPDEPSAAGQSHNGPSPLYGKARASAYGLDQSNGPCDPQHSSRQQLALCGIVHDGDPHRCSHGHNHNHVRGPRQRPAASYCPTTSAAPTMFT